MAKRSDPTEHRKLLASLAVYLESNNFENIKVDGFDAYEQPDEVRGSHIPDATAEKSGTEYIYEVETKDSINDTHTRDQWGAFAGEAANYGWKRFIVVVPKGHKNEAEQRVFMLDLNIDGISEFSLN